MMSDYNKGRTLFAALIVLRLGDRAARHASSWGWV